MYPQLPFLSFEIDPESRQLIPVNSEGLHFLEKIGSRTDAPCFSRLFGRSAPCEFCKLSHTEGEKPSEITAHEIEIPLQAEPVPELTPYLLFQSETETGHIIDIIIPDQRRREKVQQREMNDKLVMLGRLVQTVAHELNNPLAGASLMLQSLMNRAEIPEQESTYLKMALDEIHRAQSIIDEIFSFKKSTSYELVRISIEELVRDCIDAFLRTQSSDIQIKIYSYLSGKPIILANAHKIRQVFENLFQNSIEAAKQDYKTDIWVLLRQTGIYSQSIEIQIIDNAGGIPEQAMRSVFDPYFTTKDTRTNLGLGLFVVQRIIHEHNGEISVHSRDSFSRFSLRFPIQN
ncbi:MAG: HAMP domain-containing histidine kinase [Leptospiraceae bacterium]|nr:HAMP domain-containing histidine kinase [Leptospiraceae bacterium]